METKTLRTPLLFLLLGICSWTGLGAQNVDVYLEPNSTDSTLEVYLQANGTDYTSEIFNSLIFTVNWTSAAGYDIGNFTSQGFWSFIAPVTNQGVEVTNSGTEYQSFGFAGSTQTFNSGFGLVLNDGVKTLIGAIDISGSNAAGLDICSFKYSNDSYTGGTNRDYYIEIAGAAVSGNTASRNSISSTYSSGSWDFCEMSNLETNDTAIIADGNYTLSSDAGLDFIQVAAGAGLEVSGGVSLSVAEEIRILADASGYGQYIGPAITINMDQYVGNSEAWRHLGIPVDGNIGDVLTLGGAPMYYSAASVNQQNLYTFDNATYSWDAVANASTNIGLNGITIYTGGGNFPVTNGLINFSGTSKDGVQSFTYSFASSPTGDANYDGWNFIANPYPSNIDFNTIDDQDANAFSSYSVWDAENGVYQTWNGAVGTNGGQQYIAPGQAFWIKSAGNDGTDLDFSEADRTFNGGNVYVGAFKTTSSSAHLIRLSAASSSGQSDETVIYFPLGSTPAFDQISGDAFKPWNGGGSNIYSRPHGSGENLAINAYGTFDPTAIIPLCFSGDTATNVTHVISLDVNALNPAWGDIYLEDMLLDTVHNLKNGSYSFTPSSLASLHRFNLKFANSTVSAGEPMDMASDIYTYSMDDMMYIAFINPIETRVEIELYDMSGQQVHRGRDISTARHYGIPTHELSKGMYMIQLISKGKPAKTLKAIVN